MAITKEQLDKVQVLEQKSNEWLKNYYQFGLSSNEEVAAQYSQVIAVLSKAQVVIKKAASEDVSKDEVGSIPTPPDAAPLRAAKKAAQKEKKSALKSVKKEAKALVKEAKANGIDPSKIEDALNSWKDLAVDWIDSGIDGLLKAKGVLDKGLLTTANEFISKAETFLSIASIFTNGELGDKVDKVKSWVDAAKKIIEKVNAVDAFLKKWRDVAVGWMESGISDVVSGANVIGNITNGIIGSASDFKSLAKAFIDGAKDLGDASLDEKVAKAKNWLTSVDTLLDKAGDKIDDLFKDADKNDLPDWYDVLSREWDKIGGKDLIPGANIDEKVIEKLNTFKTKVDEWMKKATAEISPAIQEKIATAKIWIKNIQQLIDLTEKGKEFVDALRNKDFNAVFDKLKTMWTEIDNVGDLFEGTDIDDKLLEKIRELKGKADEFAKMANSLIAKLPGGDKLGEVQDWIKKAMEIATDMANGEDVVGKYIELAKEWASGEIKKVVDGAKEVSAEVAGQVSGFVNEVKKFMAGASAMKKGNFADKIAAAGDWIKSSQGILDKASEIIGLAVGDADGNNLPDWYDKLAAAWDKIGGKDLIPGTDIDDAILGKVNVFKGEVEKWLEKAVGVGGDLQDKINTAKQWVEKTSGFLKEVAGFVQDIKDGDMLSVYEKLKAGWAAIGNTDDILAGTDIDNRILDKAKDLKDQAEAWLANALSGGKADGQMTDEVKDILGMADNFLTFIFTKYEVEDHSHEFQEDKIVINFPNARELTAEQSDALLGEFSGGFEGPLKNKLVMILQKINQDIIELGGGIDTAYRKTINAGGGAAQVYIKAKGDYDSVMKKQKDVMKLLESVRKVVVGAITLALVPVNPAIAAAVGTLLSGTVGGFGELAGLLAKTASDANPGGTAGQIGGFLSSILPSGAGTDQMGAADNVGLINLLHFFNKGVTDKFEQVKEHVSKIQVEIDKIYTELYKLDDAGTENAKTAIATSADQFKRLRESIRKNYINTKETRINEKNAYFLLSRAQYAGWLSQKKDTMIVDEVIDKLRSKTIHIMQDADVEWNTGVGGDIAKGLGWLFGGWASFGYDKKVKKLREWSKKELGRLQNEAVWRSSFS